MIDNSHSLIESGYLSADGVVKMSLVFGYSTHGGRPLTVYQER